VCHIADRLSCISRALQHGNGDQAEGRKWLHQGNAKGHDSACSSRFWPASRVALEQAAMTEDLTEEEIAAFELEIAKLREEHSDLDAAIMALESSGPPNQIQVQRLKKRKLWLKDRISYLEDQITPDIIA
jgi:hypothetical protein